MFFVQCLLGPATGTAVCIATYVKANKILALPGYGLQDSSKVPRVSPWLSLPDCLRGLRAVLQQLTGVTLQEESMLPG